MHEAKTQLSKLITNLEKGEDKIQICRHGVPVAEIIPIKKKKGILRPHPELSKIKINYDPTEPLAEEEWPELFC